MPGFFAHLRDHWLGRHSLRMSIWLNLVFPAVVLLLIHRHVLNELVARDILQARPTALILLVLYSALLCWQLVGIRRASHREAEAYGSANEVYLAYGLIFLLILFIAVNLIDVLTNQDTHRKSKHMASTGLLPLEPSFVITSVDDTTSTIRVHGTFGVAATRQLSEYLNANADVQTLILSSDGGSIFEARGVARLITENKLATHVSEQCLSACTLAFVHGVVRTAEQSATFGFHGYRLDSEFPNVGLSIDEQQRIDSQAFVDNNVALGFVNQIFDMDSDQLWYPSRAAMLEANFLTEGQ